MLISGRYCCFWDFTGPSGVAGGGSGFGGADSGVAVDSGPCGADPGGSAPGVGEQ